MLRNTNLFAFECGTYFTHSLSVTSENITARHNIAEYEILLALLQQLCAFLQPL